MSTQPLFDPFTIYDGLCTFGILIGSMIAAGGGLGGGGVFVPIYILVLSFTTKNAAALSQATIFGGSIINLIMNWTSTHPIRKHRPLTDFQTLLVFEPMLLVGTVLGVLLNVIFPAMLILILLIITLVYATIRTTKKGYVMWNEESQFNGYITNGMGLSTPINDISHTTTNESVSDSKILQGYDTTDSLNEPLLKEDNNKQYGSVKDFSNEIYKEMAEMCGVNVNMLTTNKIEILQPLMEKEKEMYKPMIIIGIIWLISSATSIGKNNNISGVESCSGLYWFITFISFPILFIISLIITKQQYNLYELKEESNGWISAKGDIKWNESILNTFKYPLIAMFAGILGGLLGIGGGMIVSPLLMELNVLPSVAAATSAMAVLITSSSATLQFVLLGYLNLDYTFYFMAIGIIGTFIGQTIVTYCVKKYGRKSLIVFSVAAIMGGAVILMGLDGILQVIKGISWTFSTPC